MLKTENNSAVFNVRKMKQPKQYTHILDAAISKRIEIGAKIEQGSFYAETDNNSTPHNNYSIENILIPECQIMTMTDIDITPPRYEHDSVKSIIKKWKGIDSKNHILRHPDLKLEF
jgi:hypothetical protein